MFLVDKYAPKTICDTGFDDSNSFLETIKINNDIDDAPYTCFHKDILNNLKTVSSDDSVPHTIFYGPEGSGKKTVIYMFLEMVYDKSVRNLSELSYSVSGSGNNETKVKVKQSKYHIVIEPNNNNSDRYLIQGVLKEYVKRLPLNVYQKKKQFKTVLINNVDNLSYYTQTALRRMMEIYSDTCRFILWCRSLNKVIDPIMSRCLSIRVPSPTDDEMLRRTLHIGMVEGLKISIDDYNSIVKNAKGNIKVCMWLLELKKYGYEQINVYQKEINIIIDMILECDLMNMEKIRDTIYKIIITNISDIKIMKDILDSLLDSDKLSEDIKHDIIHIASDAEFNLMRGRRKIVHLEAFIQRILHCLKIIHKFN